MKLGLDKLFHFGINQNVKVQVFHIITRGVIVERCLREDNKGYVVKKYTVQFSDKTIDTVEAWEDDLVYVQTLKVGSERV